MHKAGSRSSKKVFFKQIGVFSKSGGYSKFEGASGKLNLLTKTRFAKAGQFAKTCFLEEQLLQVSNPRYHFVKATLENGKQCLTRGKLGVNKAKVC